MPQSCFLALSLCRKEWIKDSVNDTVRDAFAGIRNRQQDVWPVRFETKSRRFLCESDETRHLGTKQGHFGTKQCDEKPRIEQTSTRGIPWAKLLATNETDETPGELGLASDVSSCGARSQLHRVGDEVSGC